MTQMTWLVFLLCFTCSAAEHPRLLFSRADIPTMKARAAHPALIETTESLFAHAQALLKAPPILVSLTKRGEPDAKGESKGISAARALQGRVLTFCMAHTLSGEAQYRDAARDLLFHALDNWKIWVDTAHSPPYDLMTGEVCMTFGLAYDWLYHDLSESERTRLREGAVRRGLDAYLAGNDKKMFWTSARHNWNTVCNGGAAVLALALEWEENKADSVLTAATANMKNYWDHLGDDGGWDEGTGYWAYGHRYGFIAAEALRRCGKKGGAEVFNLLGAKNTGNFPLVFNPGRTVAAGFGDSNGRANDAIFYLLAREYKNSGFAHFQDRAPPATVGRDGWPHEALKLLWKPVDEPWLKDSPADLKTARNMPDVCSFSSIGWGFMASNQPDPNYFLAFKNGSLAANHTHLDLNHISVGLGETMVLVELGSRPYPADYFGKNRHSYYEIDTAGHNTFLVGGKGQVLRRKGELRGPFRGTGFDTLIGIADGAYEVSTPVARRSVSFIQKKYWIVVDEIQTETAQSTELRWHTSGSFKKAAPFQWSAVVNKARVDIYAFGEELSDSCQAADGWIEPVNVLRFLAKERKKHRIVSVLIPGTDRSGMASVNLKVNEDMVMNVCVEDQNVELCQCENGIGWTVNKITEVRHP